MLHDSILRCLVPVKFGNQTSNQIFDAVKEREECLIVLEWGTPDENQDGITPKQYVAIPLSEIETEDDHLKGYEIISHMGIDLDVATVTDVADLAGRLFQPPPK